MTLPGAADLARAGLNLQAVFAVAELPAEMAAGLRQEFDREGRFGQLILLGHGGRRLWEAVEASGIASEHRIDDYSVGVVDAWVARHLPGHRHRLVYPGDYPVGLQSLGKLAGWHHPSPFMVGINADWGTWFAYRVALLADTALPPTAPVAGVSPCAACAGRPCVTACPAGAAGENGFDLAACIAYRREANSRCHSTCQSRLACPVGAAHRYCEAQIERTYALSLRMIVERGG